MSNIQQWAKNNLLQLKTEGRNLYSIEGIGKFLHVMEKNGYLFDENFHLCLSDQEADVATNMADFLVFEFGTKFYYIKKFEFDKPKLRIFKYLGKAEIDLENHFKFGNLGVHGKYELLNGSSDYDLWCEKAKFLGHSYLALVEKNTLAGIVAFQSACQNSKIKPIFGESVEIRLKDSEKKVEAKLYVNSLVGWRNLLHINKYINGTHLKDSEEVFNYISEDLLIKHSKDITLVISGDINYLTPLRIKKFKESFTLVFYQIDTVVWRDKIFDIEYLENINNYLNNYSEIISPILINDSYYLDEEDVDIKEFVNKVANIFQNSSKNQYYKGLDKSFQIWNALFKKDDERATDIFMEGVNNSNKLAKESNFEIIPKFHLPEFSQAHLPEILKEENNEKLFWRLVEEGINKYKLDSLNKEEFDIYLNRIEEEFALIYKGGFVDYFLILWDMLRYCDENKILVGLGRGSAAGSLIAYLLNITRIDPLKYDLLFERFLNPGRIGEKVVKVELENGEFIIYKLEDQILLKSGKIILAKDLQENFDIDFESS